MNRKIVYFVIYNGNIKAVWYRGCVQPYLKWRKVVKSLYPTATIERYYFAVNK